MSEWEGFPEAQYPHKLLSSLQTVHSGFWSFVFVLEELSFVNVWERNAWLHGHWMVTPGLGEGSSIDCFMPRPPSRLVLCFSPILTPLSFLPGPLSLSPCGFSGQMTPSFAVSLRACSRSVVLKLGCTLGLSESLTKSCPLGTTPEILM